MYYFKKNGDYIEKYNVNIESDSFDYLINKCKENCSYLKLKKYNGDLDIKDNIDCKNQDVYSYYKAKINNDICIYEYIYGKLVYPRLIGIIERILNNDEDALYELLDNYEIEYPNYYNEEVEVLTDKIKNGNIKKFDNSVKAINELKVYRKIMEKNKDKISTESFYKVFVYYIHLELVDKMSLEEINRVNDFFDNNEGKILKRSLK